MSNGLVTVAVLKSPAADCWFRRMLAWRTSTVLWENLVHSTGTAVGRRKHHEGARRPRR
ncbi:hypothetical protein SacxiDRAFT_2790 [Saccharomonospora xinjiangensis XJ-54]|uniref:Uncharacterized protein n=1 Tax=Saccharomonospora xinjiangensis XJ-54 TaxID=882086 RepID=I0V4F6_9PSEU|nr:hypothetical protein SacxiDRAFT_2790 [Saccharomonospora xinjiangensis XJ-54]